MYRWDTIDEFDRPVILNAAWPQDRGCYWVEDPTSGDGEYGAYVGAFVLDDCAGDAVESMACANGHEGDDDGITVRAATPDERAEVMRRVNAWMAALEQA